MHLDPSYGDAQKVVQMVRPVPLSYQSSVNILLANVLKGNFDMPALESSEELAHKLREKVPFPVVMLDLAEAWLVVGERGSAENCLAKARKSSDKYLMFPDISFIGAKVAQTEAKMGIEYDSLTRCYAMLQEFPRGMPMDEQYRTLAMTAIDCMHLYTPYQKYVAMIESCIRMLSNREGRSDAWGFAARKLAMRDEFLPSTGEMVELGESMLKNVKVKLDIVITLTQLAVARALLGDMDHAQDHFRHLLEIERRSDEKVSYLIKTSLLRAYAQSGFRSEASALESELIDRYDDILHTCRENLLMSKQMLFQAGRLPKGLGKALDGLLHIGEFYVRMIVTNFILAGMVTRSRSYMDRAGEMLSRMMSGFTKFSLCLELSAAYSSVACAQESLKVLQLAADDLKAADRKVAGELFHEMVERCAECYYYTGERKFVDAVHEYARLFGVGKAKMSDACYDFCRKMAALAKDRYWRINTYIH